MRPLSLLISGQPADLPASTKGLVKLQQARALLADLSARWGLGALSITLPATRGNQQLFGVDKLHPQGRHKFGYYADYAAEIRSSGAVFTGTFRLTSLKNGYTGTFIGDSRSWALLLGDKKLTDLRFAPVAYDGSQLESVLALDCDASDLQFPLVAYGNFFNPPTQEVQPDGSTKEVPAPPSAILTYPLAVDDYPPSVYYGNVLRQMFASIGWQLRSRELDSDFWRQVVMLPAGADVEAAWNWGALLKASQAGAASTFSYYQDSTGNYGNSRGGFDQNRTGEVFYLPLACPLVASPTRALEAEAARYTAPRNGVYSFEWAATLASGHQTVQVNPFGLLYRDYFQPVGLGLVVRRGGQDHTGADGGLVTGEYVAGAGVPNYAAGQDSVLTPHRLDTGGNGLAVGASFSEQVSVYLEAGDSVELVTFARRRLLSDTGGVRAVRTEFVAEWTGVKLACTKYVDDKGVSKELIQPADFLPPLSCADVLKDFLVRTDSFLVCDASQRLATLLTRAELPTATGPVLDLSDLCAPAAVEYQPAVGADVGSLVFAPAALSDDALVSETADVVTASIGPGEQVQNLTSQFAAVGFRTYYVFRALALPVVVSLPCCATTDTLKQDCSDSQWDVKGQTPRLLRYTGAAGALVVPFLQRRVPLAGAAWDGMLAWDGAAGAVASYYQPTLRRCLAGHLAKFAAPLSPALFTALAAGRAVYLNGAAYTVESIDQWDVADEAALATLTLALDN